MDMILPHPKEPTVDEKTRVFFDEISKIKFIGRNGQYVTLQDHNGKFNRFSLETIRSWERGIESAILYWQKKGGDYAEAALAAWIKCYKQLRRV